MYEKHVIFQSPRSEAQIAISVIRLIKRARISDFLTFRFREIRRRFINFKSSSESFVRPTSSHGIYSSSSGIPGVSLPGTNQPSREREIGKRETRERDKESERKKRLSRSLSAGSKDRLFRSFLRRGALRRNFFDLQKNCSLISDKVTERGELLSLDKQFVCALTERLIEF